MHLSLSLPLAFFSSIALALAQNNNTLTPPTTLGYVSVSGAQLYYEVQGTGPLLVLISGASGDTTKWRDAALTLAANYTVATYDRRGFSHSHLSLSVPQNYTHRVETDADDLAALIKHLSPENVPATVLGTSSGAIVALAALTRHPALLKFLLVHEPPALSLLPDAKALAQHQHAAYAAYRAGGLVAGYTTFFAGGGIPHDEQLRWLAQVDPKRHPFVAGNTAYWFEREITTHPLHAFDMEAIAAVGRQKLVLVCGVDTLKGAPHFRANEVLGREVGVDIQMLPGGHVGYFSHPVEWAEALGAVLKGRE